jgi:hypothetical protein
MLALQQGLQDEAELSDVAGTTLKPYMANPSMPEDCATDGGYAS